MALTAAVEAFYRRRWATWLKRRIPPTRDITLNQRRVFIFLSRHGVLAGMLLLCVFIAGVNYANNLLLGFSFFLGSLFVIAIHHTFANLSGLRIRAISAGPAFAGEPAPFVISLSNPNGRPYYSLDLAWADAAMRVECVDQPAEVTLYLLTDRRGRFHPPRLKISTVYPLGMLRAWTWLDIDLEAIVYPRREPSDVMPVGGGAGNEAEHSLRRRPGIEDFEGLKPFTPGDPLAHISWKHLARGQGMQVKTFSEPVAGSDLLDYSAFQGLDRETRLSRLAWWAVRLHDARQPFGLKLPHKQIPVGQDARHLENCLVSLALFEEGA